MHVDNLHNNQSLSKKNIMKRVFLFCLLFSFVTLVSAHEYRSLLQKKASLSKVNSSVILNQEWVDYPDYSDRAGWDKLIGDAKEELIKKGEASLDYEWKIVKATDYIEYERSGSRNIMQQPFGANNTALSNLVLAELAEGKGRFIDQIINGVWQTCDMTSWALSAHVISAQAVKTSLPSHKEHVIDLTAGDLSSFLSWTYYFLKDEMDKVNPLVSERLRDNLQERILDTYMERSDFWWQAFYATPSTMVNNWNPWCNFNILNTYLLLENDPQKLGNAIYRSMVSVDKFINYTKSDGACEEGPSYWGHAAGKMYDYLQLLSTATNGVVDIFDEPIIKNMGEYIAKSYIGDGWVVNFADASAKGGGPKGVIYRYGKAVNSPEMMSFASYLYERDNDKSYFNAGRDMFRTLENLKSHNELINTKAALSDAAATWYPDTEFCYMRNDNGFFFGAKGGFNNESHNHNDVGSFILYHNETPIFIDAGVGTYTRQTFGSERYNIWTMISEYHNLPVVNGVPQSYGSQYKSKDAKFDRGRSTFSLDLADAYSSKANIEKWKRTYQLTSKNGLMIEDDFRLSETNEPNKVNFLTWGKPDISTPGSIKIEKEGAKVKMIYNASQFDAEVETVTLDDKRLSNVWGNEIYRLTLKAKKMQKSGKYSFKVTTN